MIIESILVVVFALGLDFTVGDPKNKYHPTSWIGKLIAKLTPFLKNYDKAGGVILVLTIVSFISLSLVALDATINIITIDYVTLIVSIIIGTILLKTTIAVRGMEKHALAVVDSIEQNNISKARDNLALIVKRNTKNLDKNHVLSGVLESVSENIVDGITGPLFYFGVFGLPGAFVYRAINTIDSMVGYKNSLFRNIGWFGANCDKVLNYIPSRLTAIVMVLSAKIIGINWKNSYHVMLRDGSKTESPNAGYPMAALAGALQTKFEKIDHYSLGDGNLELTKTHVKSAIDLMKVTAILFSLIVTIPTIILLYYLGWWIHA